jgi:hypothetical protein
MSALITALRAALSAEHAAIYVLGVLASRTSPGPLADALADSFAFHRDARDTLLARLAELGDDTPPAAAAAYDLPDGLGTEAGVRAAALALEQRATAAYGDQVAATSSADRTRAIGWLSATAVRQLRFGGAPSTYPGLA